MQDRRLLAALLRAQGCSSRVCWVDACCTAWTARRISMHAGMHCCAGGHVTRHADVPLAHERGGVAGLLHDVAHGGHVARGGGVAADRVPRVVVQRGQVQRVHVHGVPAGLNGRSGRAACVCGVQRANGWFVDCSRIGSIQINARLDGRAVSRRKNCRVGGRWRHNLGGWGVGLG